MRKVFLFFLFIGTGTYPMAQNRVASPDATLEHTNILKADPLSFTQTEYDFGKIPQGKPVTHIFQFKNTGREPLVLTDVKASCGCTTPVWSRDTIPAGGLASIKVGFNAATEGSFVKPVFITYNGGQSKQIIIKGDVWKTPADSAPQNQLVHQLNQK